MVRHCEVLRRSTVRPYLMLSNLPHRYLPPIWLIADVYHQLECIETVVPSDHLLTPYILDKFHLQEYDMKLVSEEIIGLLNLSKTGELTFEVFLLSYAFTELCNEGINLMVAQYERTGQSNVKFCVLYHL